MVKALISYGYDSNNPSLLKVSSVPSELFTVIGWYWTVEYEGWILDAWSGSTWDIDFSLLENGAAQPGAYHISLFVSSADGGQDDANLVVGYNEHQEVGVFLGIWDQVIAVVNGAIAVDNQEFLVFRNKWQEVLGPSLGIDPNHYHQEIYWNSMANTLIAYLITRDYIQSSANRMLIGVGGSTVGSGAIKRVETGPVNSEWFDPGSIYANIFKPGGLWEDLAAGICGIAAIVGVYITGCLDSPTIPPTVTAMGDYSYIQQYIIAPQFKRR